MKSIGTKNALSRSMKHKGKFEDCPRCQGLIAKLIDGPYAETFKVTQAKSHRAAQRRAEREQAMRDCGLVKTQYGWE